MNFAIDLVDAAPAGRLALVALARDGRRSEITFGEVSGRTSRLAGALAARGIGRGDVVMTMIGNRPEWVYAMVACFRIGAVALPSTEQLRANDLRARFDKVEPRLVISDERNLATIAASGYSGDVIAVPDERLVESAPAPAVDLSPTDPALITFTSGTSGDPKPIRGRATCAGARRPADGRSRRATPSSRPGCAGRLLSSRTRASTPTSGWPWPSANG
jgi:acyl-coenzyme A synthetase/AMP-(fatty) acid ligase